MVVWRFNPRSNINLMDCKYIAYIIYTVLSSIFFLEELSYKASSVL